MSWEDKGVLVPRRAAVTVEDIEVRKEGSRLELTELPRERVGDVVSEGMRPMRFQSKPE